MQRVFILLFIALSIMSCRDARIKEHKEWGAYFDKAGVTDGCFIIRDNNHESVQYFNLNGCATKYAPGATFNILSSLIALEKAVATDDQLVLPGNTGDSAGLAKPITMRNAFNTNNDVYFAQLNERIGLKSIQHFLDTVQYGNKTIANTYPDIPKNGTLKISADEQVGFLKRMYFFELPFTERSQRIVKTMMLKSKDSAVSVYYVASIITDSSNRKRYVIAGITEFTQHVKEMKESLNKSDERDYPYFFSGNWLITNTNQNEKETEQKAVNLVLEIMKANGVFNKR